MKWEGFLAGQLGTQAGVCNAKGAARQLTDSWSVAKTEKELGLDTQKASPLETFRAFAISHTYMHRLQSSNLGERKTDSSRSRRHGYHFNTVNKTCPLRILTTRRVTKKPKIDRWPWSKQLLKPAGSCRSYFILKHVTYRVPNQHSEYFIASHGIYHFNRICFSSLKRA